MPSKKTAILAVTATISSIAASAVLSLPASASLNDTDGDGMPNRWEIANHLSVKRANANGDPDHDGLTNLREVPEFVANIVTMDLLEKMNFTSGDFPHDEDEFGWAGLTPGLQYLHHPRKARSAPRRVPRQREGTEGP